MDSEKEGTRRKIGTELRGNLGLGVVIHLFSILSSGKDLVRLPDLLSDLGAGGPLTQLFKHRSEFKVQTPVHLCS